MTPVGFDRLINVRIRDVARPRNGESSVAVCAATHLRGPRAAGRELVPAGPILEQEDDRRNRRCRCERVAQRGDRDSIARFAARVLRAFPCEIELAVLRYAPSVAEMEGGACW